MSETQIKLPPGIYSEVRRLAIEWDGAIPAWAEMKHPGQPARYKQVRFLTVADFEQLVEQHIREGNKAIARFQQTGSRRTARFAANHIIRARIFRGLYQQAQGLPHDEADMPFGCLNDMEVEGHG